MSRQPTLAENGFLIVGEAVPTTTDDAGREAPADELGIRVAQPAGWGHGRRRLRLEPWS